MYIVYIKDIAMQNYAAGVTDMMEGHWMSENRKASVEGGHGDPPH